MAASNLNLGKASGGVLNVQPADGTTNTSLILPESGTVTTNEYVNSSNLGNGSTTFNGFGGTGFKNYIINGNFDIWQYKDAGMTYPQTSSGYGSDDRWFNINTGSTKNHSQVACTDTERALFNASYFSRTVVTSVAGAGNECDKWQNIEDVSRLAGKTVTLSFWAKADSAKNIGIWFDQVFGSGGSSAITLISNQLVALTTTWQKKTITVTLPSIVGKTVGLSSFTRVVFGFDNATALVGRQSGTFDIAQVQLEVGSIATPFEQRPIGLELSLCQRYFEINARNGVTDTGTPISLAFLNTGGSAATSNDYSFKVNKRTAPTLTIYNPFSGGTTSQVRQTWGTSNITVTASQATPSSFNLSIGQSGTYTCLCHFSASAEL